MCKGVKLYHRRRIPLLSDVREYDFTASGRAGISEATGSMGCVGVRACVYGCVCMYHNVTVWMCVCMHVHVCVCVCEINVP